MMFEIIRSQDSRFDEYEQLLLERDRLRRDARDYMVLYIHEFGDLLTAVFRLKVSCIEKKKTIAFCQKYVNLGEHIDINMLNESINREMSDYYKQLEDMAKENEMCRELRTIPEAERLKIKSIYRKIARQLHPDINPLTAESEELSELWNRTAAAYNCRDVKGLRELEILINAVLCKMGGEPIDVEIPDIELKIEEIRAEIDKIISTDPYQYHKLLESEELIAMKKEELEKELSEYTDYEKQLNEILKTFLANGADLSWQTN